MIGKSSPTAPAANTNRPNLPASMPRSRRIGSNVPSAVVVNPMSDGEGCVDEPHGGESADDQHRDRRADQPGDHGLLSGPLPQQRRIQLVSREEEQKAQPQSRDQLDLVGSGEPQNMGADENAAKDEEQDLRRSPGRQAGDDRRDGSDGHHQQQRPQRSRAHLQVLRSATRTVALDTNSRIPSRGP